METKFQTSFVPKKPITVDKSGYDRKAGPSVFTLIATVIFFGTVLFAIGLYALVFLTENDIKRLDKDIVTRWQTFDPVLVKDANRLNDRIESTKNLLNKHVAPSRIFNLLELKTLQAVSFTKFNMSRDDKGNIVLEGEGVAKNPQSIVLQSDEFGNTGKLKSVLFSEVAITDKGVTSFKFQSILDSDFLLFSNYITEGALGGPRATTTTSTSSSKSNQTTNSVATSTSASATTTKP